MAKKYTVEDILKNPKLKHRLTTQQLAFLVEDLTKARQKTGGSLELPSSPAQLAEILSNGLWEFAPHLRILDQWLKEAANGERKRILVSMPPRHGKSELISYWLPIWYIARNPKKRVIFASYEADFAAGFGGRVRNSLLEFKEQLAVEIDDGSTARDNWKTMVGGGMVSVGAGGALTGRGADLFIIDDPIKNSEEASSEVIREKIWNWFQTTAFTRLEPGGAMIIVATRWHEDDLIGRIEKEARKEEGAKWDVLKFPAVATEADILGRNPGDPLWAKRYDLKALDEIKRMNSPYNWSALYQQSPSPEEGGGVKRAWWKYYKEPPAKFDQMIQAWDMALKDKETSDYTVGQVWGRVGAEFFLLHQIRGHMSMPEIISAMRSLTAMYPQATAKVIEDAAAGPSVIAMLQKEVYGMIPWPPKGARKADKGIRLNAVTPLIAAGNVYLPENPDGTKPVWVHEFVEECAAFPQGTNDDQLDAMVHALTYFQPQAWLKIGKDFNAAKRGEGPNTLLELQAAKIKAIHNKWINRKAREVNGANSFGVSSPKKLY